jgi:hypothetical protein
MVNSVIVEDKPRAKQPQFNAGDLISTNKGTIVMVTKDHSSVEQQGLFSGTVVFVTSPLSPHEVGFHADNWVMKYIDAVPSATKVILNNTED